MRGVALVAVLSVLVVLALLAASLAVLMQIEAASARTHIGESQLYLLLDSSLAHAKSLIYATQATADGQPIPQDLLLERFAAHGPDAAAPWINVYDQRNMLCGRYSLTVEDEGAKVNLNSAFLLAPSQGSGWTPGELNLSLALGVPPRCAESLVAYRYGRNNVPGARGDDDENNIFLMTDGIDNDADGVVDGTTKAWTTRANTTPLPPAAMTAPSPAWPRPCGCCAAASAKCRWTCRSPCGAKFPGAPPCIPWIFPPASATAPPRWMTSMS